MRPEFREAIFSLGAKAEFKLNLCRLYQKLFEPDFE